MNTFGHNTLVVLCVCVRMCAIIKVCATFTVYVYIRIYIHVYINIHIYSTLFRLKKQRNRAKKGITKHTHIKQGHVTLIYCINIKLPSSFNG